MKPVITADHRAELIMYLDAFADEASLVEFVEQVQRGREHIAETMKTFRASQPKKVPEVAVALAPTGAVRLVPAPTILTQQQEPPGVAAKRVTTSTQTAILSQLKKHPSTSSQINQAINGRPGNTVAVLKLMWSRKVITWNATTGFYSLT